MKRKILLSVFTTIIVLVSCKKNENSSPRKLEPDGPPAITPIGAAVGSASSKTIGNAGGSLTSPDGRIELTFPAGAISSNTTITIQPVINYCPGGVGLAYHLTPDNISFSKPVTLTYHYTNEEVNGTHPYFFYVAYQDSSNKWKADYKNRSVDTVAKTVSLGITHFSIWSLGDNIVLNMTPHEEELYADETREFRAVVVSRSIASGSGDDELPPLPQESPISDQAVINWKVNGTVGGNAQNGTIIGNGSKVSYKAPSVVETERTVQVAVELNYSISFFNNGRLVSSTNRLILFKDIKLLPSEFEYAVETDFSDAGITGWLGQTYRDKASFDLFIKKTKDNQGLPTLIILASNFKNYAPTVTPTSQTYADPLGVTTITFDWIPDGVGQTNITGVTLASFDDTTVTLDFVHSGAVSPGFNWRSSLGTSGTIPLTPLGGTYGIPSGIRMKLIRQNQTDKWVKITAK